MEKKGLKNYIIFVWLFIYGSFSGFIYENLLMLFRGHWALRQGLIYGPLIPVYGVGLIVFYLFARKVNIDKNTNFKKLLIIFLIASFLGGLVEYIFSFLQEKIWGTISWNYSYMKFNFNGRTSLSMAALWGLLFIAFCLLIYPQLKKHKHLIDLKTVQILSIIVSIMLIFDCSISFAATYRQKERKENIEASNILETYLDKHYTDEYLDRIYNNAKEVNSK